jgi:hypothetical protein
MESPRPRVPTATTLTVGATEFRTILAQRHTHRIRRPAPPDRPDGHRSRALQPPLLDEWALPQPHCHRRSTISRAINVAAQHIAVRVAKPRRIHSVGAGVVIPLNNQKGELHHSNLEPRRSDYKKVEQAPSPGETP